MSRSKQTINPATEETLASYDLMSREEAGRVIEQTHQAFLQWRKTSFEERAERLRKVASLIRERKDDYAALMTQEMGKTLASGKQECELCAAICEYAAEHGAEELAEQTRDLRGGRALISYQPIGVIYGIQPWNFPLYQVIRYSADNLMVGNTVLLKHAGNVWGMALEVEKLYRDAGLPENVKIIAKPKEDTARPKRAKRTTVNLKTVADTAMLEKNQKTWMMHLQHGYRHGVWSYLSLIENEIFLKPAARGVIFVQPMVYW